MDQLQRQIVKKYLDVLLRRKKMIISFLLVSIVAGLGMYLKTNKVYQCTSLIKYQRQRINPTVMSPEDNMTRTREVVATVSQQITSRSSLEKMIKEFDLYAKKRAMLPMEDVVDIMREKHIDISPDRGDIFKVSYQGRDPKKVQRVTNALAAKFIEENLRYREERASETSAYVQDELRMAKGALDEKEAVMRDYKLKYYNEMPAQRQNNMGRLSALQEQYQNSQESSQGMQRTKILVQEQISLREELLAQQLSGMGVSMLPADSQQAHQQGGLVQITQLKHELQNLLTKYTEKHPEVKRIKKQLENLEKKIADSDQYEGIEEEEAQSFVDPQTEQLKRQIKDLEYNISRLKKERQEIKEQIKKYQGWVEATPVREAEWAALTRDYEQLHGHYQALVSQSLQAESAYSLEKQQKGSQFKIVDPAHFPENPFKPDFKKIMLMAIGLGLGLGGGLAVGMELLGTSFKDPAEVEAFLDVPVVCAVPLILTKGERRRKKVTLVLWLVLLAVALAGVGAALLYSWMQGMIIL